jgi:gluconolactonase
VFAPPRQLETRIHARIPDYLRLTGRHSDWAQQNRGGLHTDCFIEGPAFDRDGNLYLVDIPYGRIFRLAPGGEVILFAEYDGFPNGLKIHRDGRIFIADRRRGLLRLDPVTRAVEPFIEDGPADSFLGLNDLTFADNGDLYFTDQGQTGLDDPRGRLFRLDSAGQLTCLLNNVPSPNGLVLNANQDCLFLAVTRGNCIWRVPLSPDAGAAKVGVFIQLSGGVGPDGLAIDRNGNLVIAHIGLGVVWLFSPLGEPLLRITSCAGRMTTNVAYGGDDGTTLFITESETGSVLAADLDVPGRPLFSHS